ncbi:MAG: hypothetical protein HC936_03765 [Leptolyngbyaceae cyanobacterium SU_3_3]|nr:hypothetical protein [Leptolyngbyaceae cyanobacterium SU_3_3]
MLDQEMEFDEGDTNRPLDRKVTLDKADRSLSELYRWYRLGCIIVDPEWQRSYVWDADAGAYLA